MGSRGRSIRLRIYSLVAIPLVTMLGLFADVAYTSITNYINLDRAPSLIQTTSEPMTYFMSTLQAERRAAFVYQSAPTAANKTTYEAAITAADSMDASQNGPHGLGYLMQALNAPATKQSATPDESAAITRFLDAVTGSPLRDLRAGVSQNTIPAITAFTGYTTLIEAIPEVFQAEASSMTDASAATQGLGLIETILAREEIDEQDALLAGALASGTLTTDERVGFVRAAGREMDDDALQVNALDGIEVAAYDSGFNTYDGGAAATLNKDRAQIQQAVEAGYPLAVLKAKGVNSATWQEINQTVVLANFQGGLMAADAALTNDQGIANGAHRTVYITGAIGLFGLILSLILTIVLARSINRRLTTLRRSALTLAREHLPSVVSRLRRGETVDVAAEAPPMRIGNDEIGQVGQAFDAVRQTAIASAVEEARLRQGVNDVFRNLARRNQSLLQRQLTLLDQMERRATDPEALDDLFKLDHLTTRMRRHAEGLIILSGAPPGRGWSAPVRIIDALRGAVSEVEDYARVQVTTQSRAALSGAAVTDVIHLLAELIENATSLSPPYTQVRVSGQSATNGFTVEIGDRGLGMKPERLAELNERLANPPDVNPANTEQLGLFVVAQLARRHGIQVTLRTSPYGGTSAIVAIPARLVVDDSPPALTSGENPTLTAASQPPSHNGNGHCGGLPGEALRNGTGPNGTGPNIAVPYIVSNPPDLDTIQLRGGFMAGTWGSGSHPQAGNGSLGGNGSPFGNGSLGGNGSSPGNGSRSGNGSHRGRHSDEVPVVTGVPVSRDVVPPFDVFTPVSRPDGGNGPGTDDPESGTSSYPDAGYGNIEGNGQGDGNGDTGGGEYNGLPRRVRQASLAPQLRDAPRGGPGPMGVPSATAASLSEMRSTLSAMQRGWQQGRSQSVQPDTEGNSYGA